MWPLKSSSPQHTTSTIPHAPYGGDIPGYKNSIGMQFQGLGYCSFQMGDEEYGVRTVKITDCFNLGSFAVTQEEYQFVMGLNPSWCDSHQVGQDTSRHPVDSVSWDDAVEFCRRLSALPAEQERRVVYRLPTEAEWECAARAGYRCKYSNQNDISERDGYFKDAKSSHPVGMYSCNDWYLFDMYGNVAEWCADWYAPYPRHDEVDPKGPSSGQFRVLRGGGWRANKTYHRSAARRQCDPRDRHEWVGFRVAF